MIWTKKIKAGALQFVLFIGTIIAVLLMSFVLISHTHTLFKRKKDITVALIQATDRGLAYSFGEPMENSEPLEVPEGDFGIATRVEKRYWGLLEIRTVTAQKGKLKFDKIGFVGHQPKEMPALYLKDDQRPMVIVGDAKITGTTYLPQRGIKMGNIQGYGYTKPQLIYGKQLQSKSTLPELDENLKRQLKDLTTPFHEPKGVEVDFKRGMVVKNSFKEETLLVKAPVIDLDRIALSGNITVMAHKIVVHATSQLRDVLLIAPEIEVLDGFRGNFQAISSNWIKVGKNVQLDYPTVLAVQTLKIDNDEKQSAQRTPNIFLEKGAMVSGTVIYTDARTTNVHTAISIDQNTMVRGEVYCTQALELKGTVYGNVTTNAFIAQEKGNAYLNHLFHGKIDATRLPLEYGGLCFENNHVNQTIKWLY